MKDTLTFLGYQFTVEGVERDGHSYISFTPNDPNTPDDVITALYLTANQNVACMRKNLERTAGMSVEELVRDSGIHL